MIACPDCGLQQNLPLLHRGEFTECTLCDATLERTRGRSITAGLACAIGTFLLLFPSNLLLFLGVKIFGMHNESRLSSGAAMLWDNHWIILATLIWAFAVILPFVRFGMLSVVLGAIRLGYGSHWLGPAYRWSIWLDTWAMPDVFLLASFVGYYRLIHAPKITVVIHLGAYFFLAAALLAMITRACIDKRSVWRAIGPELDGSQSEQTLSCTVCDLVQPLDREGKRCPRCGARLHTRKPFALMRATALITAAFVLFFPANILPMNTSIQMGRTVTYTIFQGIREAYQAGLWPISVIVFCTSIGIPAIKILGMGWFILSIFRRSRKHLVAKTKFYRFIAEIGRWSNMDPFTLAVFVPLMTFEPFASAQAGWGALAFIGVVVLTLLASLSFDPRLMWDAAERRKS